jgi:hypothetical protein
MNKSFTVAGTSVLNGKEKVRFANDLETRVKVLYRNGHTDVDLIPLPMEMDKEQAVLFLQTLDRFKDKESVKAYKI